MRSFRLLAVMHFGANAVLLWLGYYWLGIGESRMSALAWSALVALALLCLTCSTYGALFAFFRTDQPRAMRAWWTAVRHLLPLIVAAAGVALVYFLLGLWADYSKEPALEITSFLTMTLRKPVKPSGVEQIFNGVLWLIEWVAIPVLLLPMIAAIASDGWSGFRAAGSSVKKWLYWIEAPVLLLCAVWLPMKLLSWVPSMSGFRMEVVSFALRVLAAYLLFVAGWLVLAFVTSGGKPRLTQPSTVVSP